MSGALDETAPTPRVPARAYVSLGLLLLVSTFALLDKAIVAYVLEPIKKEFLLSDAQLGLISGVAFGLSFALAGLPLGLAADRVNRRNLVALCLAFWGAMTAAGGFATNFVTLLLSRVGVGAGEAGAGPGILSILADMFPPARRATAMSIYALATPLGAIAAYMIAAHLLPSHGWRAVFIACGAPAILLAPVLLLLVPEPARGQSEAVVRSGATPGLADTVRFVVAQPALRHLVAAITLTTVTMNGIGMWIMSFFARIHHVDFAAVGPVLAFAFPLPALAGTLLSGVLADRFARRDIRWRVWIPAIGAAVCALVTSAMLLSDDWTVTLILWAGYGFTSVIWYGPGYALAVSLVGVNMRATMVAILFLLTNLIGYGLSPLLVGALSDLFAAAGDQSLRYAMLIAGLVNLWAALHFVLAGPRLATGLDAARR